MLFYADKLRDPLLLVHGTGDDNVHPQNTLQLIESFVRAGVTYDSEFYPNQKHGFRNDSLKRFYARMTAFFDLHLRALPPEAAAPR